MAYVDNLTMLLLMVESKFDTLSFVVKKLHLLQLHFSSFVVFERKPSFGKMYPAHFTHFSADMYVPNSVGSYELRKNETYSKFAAVESSFNFYIYVIIFLNFSLYQDCGFTRILPTYLTTFACTFEELVTFQFFFSSLKQKKQVQ